MRPFNVPVSPRLAALTIVVATNVLALGHVWLNRSGEPDSTLFLTERELRLWPMPGRGSAEIASELHLHWRVSRVETSDAVIDSARADPTWPQPEELRVLGFDIPEELDTFQRRLSVDDQIRTLFIVLELEGAVYQRQLAQALSRVQQAAEALIAQPADERARWLWDSAQREYEQESQHATRLFVVDAGLDPMRLRTRYADRTQYAIVEARLRLSTIMGHAGSRRISAKVEDLSIGAMAPPHEFREILKHTVHYPAHRGGPRYAGAVNFGRRFDPWITEMTLLHPNMAATGMNDPSPPPLAPVDVQD